MRSGIRSPCVLLDRRKTIAITGDNGTAASRLARCLWHDRHLEWDGRRAIANQDQRANECPIDERRKLAGKLVIIRDL